MPQNIILIYPWYPGHLKISIIKSVQIDILVICPPDVMTLLFKQMCLFFNPPVQFLDEEKKLTYIFIFPLLCAPSEGFMKAIVKAFIKPFEAPQRSGKIKS